MAEPSSNAGDAKLRPDATEIKFILFLLKEAVDGNAPYNWATVTDKFNDISEKSYSLKQISGKYSRLKKRYVAFTHLMGRDDMKILSYHPKFFYKDNFVNQNKEEGMPQLFL